MIADPRSHEVAERSEREAERDEDETGFTGILRSLFSISENVLAVAFVDRDGECVDCVSTVSSHEAKVFGAQMHVLVQAVVREARRRARDESYFLHLVATRRELAARRIDDEYTLVLVVEPETLSSVLLEALDDTAHRLRAEAGLVVPSWDAFMDAVEVELRPAVGWEYAPRAFRHRGRRIAVADVIGRWHEDHDGGATCFRVRTRDGVEFTLVYHPGRDLWTRKT